MKKWIANKLFSLAMDVDFEQIKINARILVIVTDMMAMAERQVEAEDAKPKRKPGRPLGSKNKPKTCCKETQS